MKSIVIATAMLTMAGTAMAGSTNIVGYTEYAINDQSFEAGVGADVYVSDNFYVTPLIVGSGPAHAFDFDHIEVKATYTLNDSVALYGKVTSTDTWSYDDTTVGLAFRF